MDPVMCECVWLMIVVTWVCRLGKEHYTGGYMRGCPRRESRGICFLL